MNPELIIPILAISTGIIIPLAVFIWQYYDAKGKRETVLEISKHLDDPSKLEELLNIFDERKKEPIDYRRNGVITIFVGAGLFFLGYFFVGNILKGVGALVGLDVSSGNNGCFVGPGVGGKDGCKVGGIDGE